MDATNQKNLARVLVTLMVGSTFLAAIAPTAEATHLLTGGTDVVIDVLQTPQTVTILNGTDIVYNNVIVPTTPAGTKLRHSTAYELTFTGIYAAAGGYGYAGTGTTQVEIYNVSTGAVAVAGTPLVQGPDGNGPTNTGGSLRNATFLVTSGSLQGPGLYGVRSVQTPGQVIATFVVYPHDDINVAVTTNVNPVTFTGGQVVVNIATGVAGAVVSSNAPGFITGSPVTDPNGNYAFISTLPMGVGTWTIYVGKDNNAGPQCIGGGNTNPCPSGSVPERMGNATLTVGHNTLAVAPVADTAFSGFNNLVSYTVKFPATNNNVFASPAPTDTTVTHWNLSVTTPSNFLFYRNVSGALPNTAGSLGALSCYNLNIEPGAATQGTCGTATPPTATLAIVNSVPQIQLQNATWQSGTYTIRLQLETDATGGFASAPEYVGEWTLSPATPTAVTLSATPSSVDVPYANSVGGTTGAAGTIGLLSPTTAAVGTTTLTLRVSGSSLNEHPLCRLRQGDTTGNPPGTGTCDPTGASFPTSGSGALTDTQKALLETDTDFTDNITISGDVLPGWKVTAYNPANGDATIVMTPARNGTITVNVTWKGATTAMTVPVNNGANIVASVENMTVAEVATFTVNVKNAFGGNVENANVWLFPRIVSATTGAASSGAFQGTGATVVVGNGAAGSGQGGNYQFSVQPSQVQDLVVYAEVGGTGGRVNATYDTLRVLPSQTLTTTLSKNETMAGLRTPLSINVSNATQGWTGTLANYKLYFLTPVQVRDLSANGTTSLFTGASIPTPVTIDSTNAQRAFFNVTLAQENDYRVWFCASSTSAITDCRTATHDNRANMPVFNVSRYTVTFSPAHIASSADIQSGAQVTATVTDRDGNLTNGTLRIVQGPANANSNIVGGVSPAGANTTGGAQVTNGVVNLTLTGVGAVGELNFEFDPQEQTGSQTNTFAPLKGNLSITPGNLTLQPSRVPILQSTLVTVRLANFTGAGLPGRVIRLCGVSLNSNFPSTFPTVLSTGANSDTTNCPAVGTTGDDGSTGLVVTPLSLSPIGVYINGSYTQRTIPVTAGILVVTVSPTAPQAGGNVTLTVTQPGGTPSTGSRVLVTRDGTTVLDATADGNGQATMNNLAAGQYTVTAIRTGFDNGTASFRVGSAPVQNETGARFELRNLVLPTTVNVGSPVTVRVTVANTGNESGTANAVMLVNNREQDRESVTLDAGANRTIEYTFTPTVAGSYSIVVRIGDVTLGPQDITVGTPPVTTPATPPTVTAPTTPPTTTATPPVTTTRTGTPATTTPSPTEPTVPGFEVVALLAALGVALLVLRRRS